ncbi:MAG: hypothetical protein Q9195_005677 [Heterodermia aff. obscurata]
MVGSMEELAKLPYDKFPLIILHENHGKYFSNTAAHEAGYDSFQTAKAFLRLSTKLEKAGTYVDAPIEQPPSVHGLAPVSNFVRGSSAIISSDEDYLTPEEEGVPVPNNYKPAQARLTCPGSACSRSTKVGRRMSDKPSTIACSAPQTVSWIKDDHELKTHHLPQPNQRPSVVLGVDPISADLVSLQHMPQSLI